MQDLWPEDIGQLEPIQVPEKILRKQAFLLGEKTGNLIEAVVSDSYFNESESTEFNYHFYIVAPTLDNYHFSLFKVSHDIALYPLTIEIDTEILSEIESSNVSGKIKIKNEEEFLEILKKILNAKKIKRVIRVLKSMIDSQQGHYELAESEIPF